jgi:hypothetical protein
MLHKTPMPSVTEVSPFARDSTIELIKKFIIYKAMGSNLFINYSLAAVQLSYKLFGIHLTNSIIESTGGAIFTGGVTLSSVKRVQQIFNERKTGTIACYVVEGLRQVENKTLDAFRDFTERSI